MKMYCIGPTFDYLLVDVDRLTLLLPAIEKAAARVEEGHDPIPFLVKLQGHCLDLL